MPLPKMKTSKNTIKCCSTSSRTASIMKYQKEENCGGNHECPYKELLSPNRPITNVNRVDRYNRQINVVINWSSRLIFHFENRTTTFNGRKYDRGTSIAAVFRIRRKRSIFGFCLYHADCSEGKNKILEKESY